MPKYSRPMYSMADLQPQKVTFADPPASEAKPPSSTKVQSAEPVLKREGGRRRAARTPTAATPSSAGKAKRSARVLKATPKAAAMFASPAADTPTAVTAVSPTSAATPLTTPKRRGRPVGSGKKTSVQKASASKAASVAVPAPDLVVIGRSALHMNQPAKRQRGAVPAQKVGMKRVAKRALKSMVQKGGRAKRV